MGYRGNGLKLRAKKGVGHNRALPAVFGFDNGIKFDGNNDYITSPGFSGLNLFDTPVSFEFWSGISPGNYLETFAIKILGASSKSLLSGILGSDVLTANGYTRQLTFGQSYPTSSKYHVVITYDGVSRWEMNLNGGASVFGGVTRVCGNLLPVGLGQPVVSFNIGVGDFYGDKFTSAFIDEFRVYSAKLPIIEVVKNFNNGAGNNPSSTEKLLVWYKFNSLENLDFSALQNGSDYRLGIKDFSGNNRHAQPINMQTNPALPNYVLQPF